MLWDVREKPQTVFLPDEKARPALGKGRLLSHSQGPCGPANDELEAALSSKFKPVKAPKSEELRKALRSALKKSPMVPHVGIRNGGIGGYTASSTAIGHLSSIFRI